ncbi:TlpA family protein disulfide reductase [Fulvivirga sediminis]|uniref:TlpA family protein disulfide reductase n=1 Tax=Fulvivirga sediminis TaxID=2803949 RepID=A0A937K0C0_9BACT|nr:TlpA disulfide reductase family protein [Fulvivirga sediminis]MBL3658208.1 TlpA family protein disulfide reductase [Fulvivirga sediminis]
MMRYIVFLFGLIIFTGCNNQKEDNAASEAQPSTTQLYYKDLIAEKTLTKNEYQHFRKELQDKYADNSAVTFHLYDKNTKEDSVIQEFKYTVKQGHKYLYSGSKAALFNYLDSPFPNKELTTLNGDKITLAGGEKPMLINFWFTQCAPCVKEMPILNNLQNKYKQQMDFVAITFSKAEEVEKFLSKHPFTFTQVTNAASFIDELGIMDYPTTIFINKDGKLIYIEAAVLGKGEEFEQLIEELI